MRNYSLYSKIQNGFLCWFMLIFSIQLAPAQTKTVSVPMTDAWNFLSTQTIGADKFLEKYPLADGRGTVIFILDSGVDVGVPGLLQTSTGQSKVIDVFDFSGQGDVTLEIGQIKQEGNEHFIEHPDGFRLYDYDKLAFQPTTEEYFIGYLDEWRFQNSAVDDINNNYIIDEQFGVLVFEIEAAGQSNYIAYVDTDADGHVDDEQPIHDYAVAQERFQLRGSNPQTAKNMLNFALKIDPSRMVASFHFDDSGHGTHVAGIAAGFEIYGKKGFHGIAPGAQIISLKIGNNTLAGNATVSGSIREAYVWGVRWAARHPETPVIFNLSYGMGSELAGTSDVELFINALLKEYENLFICVSAGNLGPGISSISRPATVNQVFTTAAMLDKLTARDLYGAELKSDRIFFFSARGGEAAKPDAIAPGLAISTVPPFLTDEKKYGSSMASPQAAGAAALLLSAVRQQNPTAEVRGVHLQQALKYGAQPLPEYTILDQGHGVLNVLKAFDILKHYLGDNDFTELLDYKISTQNPIFPKSAGETAYWRTGGYFPTGNDQQVFYIAPIFAAGTTPDRHAQFYRAFELASTQPWLKTDKKYTYIRGTEPTTVQVHFQAGELKSPGLYTGKIVAYRKGWAHQPENIEFELVNTIIVPYQFHPLNDYQHQFRQQKLPPGDYRRYFFQVPPGASAVHFRFDPAHHQYCSVHLVLFDPAGRRFDILETLRSEQQNSVTKLITGEDLRAGIWELVVYSDFTEKRTSHFHFDVNCTGLALEPQPLTQFQYPAGIQPGGEIRVTNLFNKPVKSTAQGVVAGYSRTFQNTVSDGSDVFQYRFRVSAEIERVVFKLNFPLESFQRFTNITTNIIDNEEKYLVKDGLTYADGTINFTPSAMGIFTLAITGAKTYRHRLDPWHFTLTEYYYWIPSKRIALTYDWNSKPEFVLYPQVQTPLNFTLQEAPPIAPDGYHLFGLVMFKEANTGEIFATLNIHLKTGLTD